MHETPVLRLPGRYYRRFPLSQPLGYAEDMLELRLDETVFLIIDVYGLGYDDGEGPAEGIDEMYRHNVLEHKEIINRYIKPAKVAAKAAGLPVVYVTNYLAPSTTEQNEWRKLSLRVRNVDVVKAWQEPCDIFRYSKVIAPEPGEYLIKKQHYSGFFETHLESMLKELNARNLVAVGFDSQVCLRGTLVDAIYRNYRVVVLRDCTATAEFPETEEGRWSNFLAIRLIECGIGYTATSQDFVKACAALSAG